MIQIIGVVVEVVVMQKNGEVVVVVAMLMDGLVVVVDRHHGEVMEIDAAMMNGKDLIKNVGDVMIILNGMNSRNLGNMDL